MLTKDLVRHKKYQNKINPQFINPEDLTLLNVARELLTVFKSAPNRTREAVLESSKFVIETSPVEAVISRGLEKLLLDRTEFDTAPNEELIEIRRNLFALTTRLLSQQSYPHIQAFYEGIEKETGTNPQELSAKLYSDLPAYQTVIKFKPFSPERLLHRYNCAQVQGLLIHSNRLDLKFEDTHPAALRQLFKYLRFHQLLATIKKDADGCYKITIDGPLNLFYQTQKYGLKLAMFFPAILHQQKWALQAEILFKNQPKYQLYLDHTCGLKPYIHHFSAFVPEEIKVFQETFRKKAEEWKIQPADNFIPLAGEYYCFPDFTLTHSSGKAVSMELFHPWHASHLVARLQHLDDNKEAPLIIGVSKVLLKDALVLQTVENSQYFFKFGFVFRDMPTMQKVMPVLKKMSE